MSDDEIEGAEYGDLLGLVVHDLRNPVATISANLSFVRDVMSFDDPDVVEALDDVEIALSDLTRGLEQLGWVGRWMRGKAALEPSPGDARSAVSAALHRVGNAPPVDAPPGPLVVAEGGTPLVRLIEILVRNAIGNAPEDSIQIALIDGADEVILEIRDGGRAIGAQLRSEAFTIAGQQSIKARADGRYSRVVGLLAARTLAEAIGADLAASGEDGAAAFRLRMKKA